MASQGWLLKEGAGLVKSFKKRWFVIRGNELFYYKTPEDKEPTGSISLKHTKVTDGGGLAFIVSGPSLPRAYNLAAENASDKDLWMKRIQAASAEGDAGSPRGGDEQMLMSDSGAKVGLKDFEVLKVIGRGSFGKVMKVKYRGNNEIYAMKALRKDVLVQENMVQNAKEEKNILQTVNHPYIVKLHFAFQTKDRLYLVIDLLPGGELFFHLKNEGSFPEPRARLYAAEISSALHHLHTLGIVYRDLKPENIVLDRGGHACLTDMGLAKTKMGANQQTYTFCGTPEYIAPEILKGTGHNKAVDWWAMGILLYEMLVGLPPFYSENVNEMYELILNKPLEFPKNVGADAQALISQLLVRDPTKRLADGDRVREQAFFRPIDWDKLSRKEIVPMWVPDLSGDAEKYVEDEFKEQSTKATVYRSEAKRDGDFQDFTFQDKGTLE